MQRVQVAGVSDIENIENDKVPDITLEIIILNLHDKSKTLPILSYVRMINSRSFSHSLNKSNHNKMCDIYIEVHLVDTSNFFLQCRLKSVWNVISDG